jgi:hypothetical protein
MAINVTQTDALLIVLGLAVANKKMLSAPNPEWKRCEKAIEIVRDILKQTIESDGHEEVFLRLIGDLLQERKPNVNMVWELSTAHITEATAGWLNIQAKTKLGPKIICDPHSDYGWWIYTPVEVDDDEDYESIPEELRILMDHARTRGIVWLLIDQDAEVEENLQTWKW